jgi:hypothetical protein
MLRWITTCGGATKQVTLILTVTLANPVRVTEIV